MAVDVLSNNICFSGVCPVYCAPHGKDMKKFHLFAALTDLVGLRKSGLDLTMETRTRSVSEPLHIEAYLCCLSATIMLDDDK